MTSDSHATKPLSVVLAGGGTAGHISPLLAIADAIREKRPEASILTVGTPSGMETRLIPAAGYELATIDRVPFPDGLPLICSSFRAAWAGQSSKPAGSWRTHGPTSW